MRTALWTVLLLTAVSAHALSLSDYLPGEAYDSSIPTPESVLGYPVGQHMVRPDQLVRYMEELADASPRVQLEIIGHTYEGRPQLLLTLSTPENLAQVDSLRSAHQGAAHSTADRARPLVLWFGYSIHGDEASGSNASMLFAYHLAAMADVESVLGHTIVLIDPSLNPDGLGRYAQWANGNRSLNPVADPIHREHNQPWVRGRFNHYWFDLNRDWLLLTHPESRARVNVLQRWRPHVVTDFHETRGFDDYFFQPGVPARTHPLTPPINQILTQTIARFHARAFDARGESYFSREGYDDFYYGKGSTYPDIQGMIGILFEQPSARGQRVSLSTGDLEFSHAVRNHLTTSMSTLDAALAHRDDLLSYQQEFQDNALDEARSSPVGGYLFGDAADPARGRAMATILHQHGIEVFELSLPHGDASQRFEPGSSWWVPLVQRQYRLIQALFERRTRFAENTFYDVSTWTFPLAFDLPVIEIRRPGDWIGDPFDPAHQSTLTPPSGESLAWSLPWNHYNAPRALQRLHQAGVRVRIAEEALQVETENGPVDLPRGSLIVPAGLNREIEEFDTLWHDIVKIDGVPVQSLTSGLARSGPDLGSPSLKHLKPVRPLLIGGAGVSISEAGEVWHLLDRRLHLPLTVVEKHRLDRVRWSDFTHLLMVDGSYDDLDEERVQSIREWVSQGGVLVASKRASAWATVHLVKHETEESEVIKQKTDSEDGSPPDRRSYGDHDADAAKDVIGGAIVSGQVDLSHPMAYGLQREHLALFRNGTTFLEPSENPYETVIRYADKPLLSGFLGEARRGQLAGSAALIASRLGRGVVVRLADNPNFRGFWYGTNRLYFNALYLATLIDSTPVADTRTRW